jgi:hypothetical protein
MRYPILFQLKQLKKPIQAQIDIQLRDAHALGGLVHPQKIVAGAKQLQRAIRGTVTLQAFKDRLSVMEHHRSGIHGQGAVGNNSGVMPAAPRGIIDQKHMISKDPAKSKLAFINGLGLKLPSLHHLDFPHEAPPSFRTTSTK